MRTGTSFPSINGHAAKELLGHRRNQPPHAFLGAIQRHAAIYVGLAVFFAIAWSIHYWALLKMEGCHRQFALMTDRTLRAIALIDWVTANLWMTLAYSGLVVAAVAFGQFRGHPAWAYRLTALMLCIPCLLYCGKCVYIVKVLFAG